MRLLIALAAVLVTGVLLVGIDRERRGSTAPASATPAARPAGRLDGAQVHMWGPGTTTRKLDDLQALGATVLRVDLGWVNLEPVAKGVYDPAYLARFDALVDGAARRHIKVIVTIWLSPPWASSGPDQHYPPRNAADLADTIRFLHDRWGGRVAFELWNEPNQAAFFKVGPGLDPAVEYARLVAGVYDAVKATASGTTIIAGSLANADYAWTGRALDAGAAHHFDAWSVHPYAIGRSPLQHDRAHPDESPIDGVPKVREVLVAHGDREPLWLTEFGHSTCSARGRPQAGGDCVSETEQAAYAAQFVDLFRSLPYVAGGIYYQLIDSAATDTAQSRYGLERADGSRKPAFEAYATALR
jgi:hypothetical protein